MKTHKVLFFIRAFLPIGLGLLFAPKVFAVDPFWTTVLAGKITAPPVSWNKKIYFIGDDKALNCVTINGSFVWRRNTDGVGNYLSLSPSGTIYLSTKRGKLQAFSSQGIPVWTFDVSEPPLYAPYSSLDGRLYVLTAKTLFCFTQHGVLKWRHELQSPPALNLAETGNGEVLLVLQNNDFLRLSIFGELREEKKLVKKVSALSKAPAGYLMACTDGSLFYYKTIAGSESMWSANTSSPCVSLAYSGGTYLAVCADGSAWLSNVKDNGQVWFAQLASGFATGEPVIRFLKNEIQICGRGFGASILSNGEIRWQAKIPEKGANSIITENGMLVGVAGKIVNSYRMEVKFLRKEPHADIPDASYAIVPAVPNDIPPLFGSAGSQKFFNEIYGDLENGTSAGKEPEYAAALVGILQNKWAYRYSQNFNDFERGEAARLLGILGSYEYRLYLIEAGYATDNRTITIGIMQGLASIAYDPDGKTLAYIRYRIERTAHDDFEMMRAVSDCLAALCKFGDNTTISNSLRTLFSIINGKFTDKIKIYTRQKIENIVQ